jgi:branched-chain amino acid transport system ATP-binding protein
MKAAAMATEALLAVDRLMKRFGGLTATDDVTLDVRRGEIHAIIGPNGAGKTTLVAQLAGELAPNGGTISFAGHDVTALRVDARARLGIARSYQITSVFRGFTALDNVALAVQAQDGHSFRFWKPARAEAALREPARAILDRVGLGSRADARVAALAHGEQRQLEIAMALATRPRLLLLDEPMAGMGKEESERLTRLLAKLKGDETMLLVEHDMDVVFALADRISVLVYGRVIATGTSAEIRADAAVRAAYLGDGDA